MALFALWNPNIQFLKTDGTINAGGKIIVTDHNDAESIPANYSDADGTTLNSSPIVLDALGRATCYIDDGSTYDLYVKDANGATLWTVPEMTPGTETIVVRGGFSVSSNDSSISVTISVNADGVTNYDLSIQKEIDRATEAEKGLSGSIEAEKNRAESAESALSKSIADETERAKEAEKGLADAIEALDVSTDLGKKADKVANATSGNFAGLDENGNLTDSGKKASDFATYEQGGKADSAIQGVKVNGTTLTPDANKIVTVPLATKSADGAMSAADKTKLDGIAAGTASPLMDGKASVGNSLKYAREDHVHPTDTSRASASHTHGNIQNGGTLQTNDITIANGDKLVVTDASDSNKVARASLTFDGATTDQMLSKKGEWNDTIAKARAVVDYGSPSKAIEIGWGGASLTSAKYFAVYTDSANGYNKAIKDCTLGNVRKLINGTSVGSAAVPVFINAGGETQVCTDDFVHDGDVTSTYSSTGTAPVNGTAVAAAIGGLDVSSVGGDGKYISAISETDGKISPVVETMDTAPTRGSQKAVTSDGIQTAIDRVNEKGFTVKEISGEQVICFE